MGSKEGHIIDEIIYSQFLQEDRNAVIYLPPQYSPLYSYPVLYAQDGDDYITFGKLIRLLNDKFSHKAWPPFIMVAVPVTRESRYQEYHIDGEQHQAYLRFFAEELIPYIDQHYATEPLAGGRALIGDSLGAHVSLSLALTYPSSFQYVISQSGAFDTMIKEKVEHYQGKYPIDIYQVVGLEEAEVKSPRGTKNILQGNQELYHTLKDKKLIQVEYHQLPGDHTWGFWQKNLPDAISFFLKKYYGNLEHEIAPI